MIDCRGLRSHDPHWMYALCIGTRENRSSTNMTFRERIVRRWSEYKYRFVPWIALNMRKQLARKRGNDSEKFLRSREEYLASLDSLFRQFHRPPDSNPWMLYKDTTSRADLFSSLHTKNKVVMEKEWGFDLSVSPSLLPNAGNGAILARGRARRGQMIALYPGTLYLPHQPILLQGRRVVYLQR